MSPSFRHTHLRGLVAALVTSIVVPSAAFARDCPADPPIHALFLGELATVQARGEWQAGLRSAREAGNDGHQLLALEIEHGFSEGVQGVLGAEAHRGEGDTRRVLEAGVGVQLACTPALRLDIGVEHAWENASTGSMTRLSAGQQHPYGSWHASAFHSTLEAERGVSAALLFPQGPRPIVFEASRERGDGGWSTWFSGGIYLFSTEHYELGIALAEVSGADTGRRYAFLNFTSEF